MSDIGVNHLREVLVGISNLNAAELDQAFNALKARRKTLQVIGAADLLAAVKVGDRVTLRGLSPKYLNGSVGTVTEIRGVKVQVELDYPVGKFGKSVGCPAACLLIVESV